MIVLHLPCGNYSVTNDFLHVCSPQLWHSAPFLVLAVFDALATVFYMVGQTKAPRYISAGEVALIGLLEDILGPIWIFARFGTAPSMWTIAGGAMLLATLVIHEVSGMRAESEPDRAAMLPTQTKQEIHRKGSRPSG